jgi:hypothetical protein
MWNVGDTQVLIRQQGADQYRQGCVLGAARSHRSAQRLAAPDE